MITIILFIVIICLLLLSKKEDKFIDITNFKMNNYIFPDNFPNVIHKTLYEDTGNETKLNKRINDAIESWIVNNPGYIIKIWDINDSREYLQANFPPEVLKCFDTLSAYAYKSDFFRYCVIYKNGGWYSDIFQICLQNNLLDNLKKNKIENYFICDKGADKLGFSDCVQNCFFGAYRYSEVLRRIIRRTIKNTTSEHYASHPINTCGSVCVLGEVFKELGYKDKDFIGYFDIEGGIYPSGAYIYDLNGTRLIKHKCLGCKINNGNDYRIMWKNKNLYNKNYSKTMDS